MSAGESQQDPSMEEILASIRRIVSGTGDSGEAQVEDSDEKEGEYLLELSKVVEDDDTAAGPAQKGEAPEAESEPVGEEAPGEGLAATDIETPGEEPVPTDVQAEVEELPAAADAEGLGEEFTAATDVAAEGEPEGESPLEPPGETVSAGFEVEPSGVGEPEIQPDAGAGEPLVGGEAADAATAPLAELAQAVELSSAAPLEASGPGGRTVEGLVAELLRPMLREWLDENLPSIIERLVAKEIRHLARRAEPD